MMPSGYTDTYHATDAAIMTLRGLVLALADVLRESDAINHRDHDTGPIAALVEVIEEKARALPRLHDAEWETIRSGKVTTADLEGIGGPL